MESWGDRTVTIAGWKQGDGPFTAGKHEASSWIDSNRLAEGKLPTGSWWRGSALTQIPKEKDRSEVRWPAADIKNVRGEKIAGKHHLCGSHLAKDVPEAKCFIPGSCHNGLTIRGHGLHGGPTVRHWSYNSQIFSARVKWYGIFR